MLEKQAKTVFIAIGSNLGNRKRNIELSKFELKKNDIDIIKSSSDYETLSWPNEKKPKFINIVLKIRTHLTAQSLLKKILDIEKKLGRKRNKKNDPRTCDIDIIDYDKKVMKSNKYAKLTLPHPKMHKRNFVLVPLFEISKTWIHPQKKISIKQLVNGLKTQDLRSIKLT